MKTKIFATLIIMAGIIGLGSKVEAQSSDSNRGKYTVSGDSLTGIDNRTAEDDFASFFSRNNSPNISRNNNRTENIVLGETWEIGDQVQLRRNQPLSTPNNVIFPQADQSFNGNDGAQLQLELDRSEAGR